MNTKFKLRIICVNKKIMAKKLTLSLVQLEVGKFLEIGQRNHFDAFMKFVLIQSEESPSKSWAMIITQT